MYVIGAPVTSYAQSYTAKQGVLDLRGVDFDESKSVALRGEWEFYWERFVEPGEFHVRSSIHFVDLPGSWNGEEIKGEKIGANGFASYRLSVLLDDSVKSMALKMNVVSTAYRLYVNGREVLNIGKAGDSKEATVAEYDPSIAYFTPTPTTEILLQVANFEHRIGGARDTIYIGKPDALFSSRGVSLLNALFLAGSFFMMGLYHLVLYIINRDESPLYFSLFCFFLTIRLLVTGDMPITAYVSPSWANLVRMEYLTFYLSGIVFLKFFSSMFLKFRIRFIEKFAYIFVGIMSLVVILAPPPLFTRFLMATQVVVLGVVIYSFYILFKEYREGNKEVIIFFLGYVFFITSIVNDILFVDEYIETGHMFSFGLFLFLGSQAALLSLRYSSAFKTNLKLLGQLNQSNLELESKVLDRTNDLNKQKETLETSNIKITHQNEELHKLNEELDSFVYSVSHDLKAPIASMLGLLHLSEQEEDMETLRKYMQMMGSSLHKQDEFIADILNYSKNARQVLHKDQIDFEKLVNRGLEQHEFVENWSLIEKIIAVEQKGEFVSDQTRISIILNNLLSNALKYCTVGSAKPSVDITVVANDQEATLIVADNGSGIDAEYQEKVFDMFYRADDKKHGSGLGLYIVKETLNKLDGSIMLESVKGHGTKITVVIPNLKPVTHE